MQFSYTAQRGDEVYSGTIDAKDRFEVYAHIRAEGGEVVSVTNTASSLWSFSYWNARLSTVKEHDKIVLATTLAAMVEAGLSVARALSVVERQTKNPRLKRVISLIRGDIQKGGSLYLALDKHPTIFSKLFVAMVRAGEESGTLGTSLRSVAAQLESAYQLKKRIKGALVYPSIILIAIVIIAFLMMTKVVPTLSATFKELGAELPASTLAIIAVSDFMVAHTLLFVVLAFVFVIVIRFLMRTERGGRIRDLVWLKIPLIGALVREIQSARTTRTLASLLGAGVDVINALDITGQVVQNGYHKTVLYEAQKRVQKGEPLSATFADHEDLFPPLVGEMVAVGEETGAVSDMLAQVADFYESEVTQKTKNMSTIIEPFLMLFIGAAVGFFAVAMVGPMYSLSNAI